MSIATPQDKTNRLSSTRVGGKMTADYWDNIFTAKERGKHVVWYNGSALNPIFQAAGLEWCHGEAFAARLAAQHLEEPAQAAGSEYGYIGELCSYARTHLGCAVLTQKNVNERESGVVGMLDQQELAAKLPAPDFFVNGYAGCSTGQQWDAMTYRVFDRKLPIFNVSIPMLWGNKPDAGYMRGEEWNEASTYVEGQLRELVTFLEQQTGRPFDWDALSESMSYIKKASRLRLEAMELCTLAPTPATYWDWVASIAPINFLPGNQALVDYFAGVKAEIQQRIVDGVSAVANERYRVYFDGIMNWNKLGFLTRKFAEYDVAVVAGRYTHESFWQEPQLIDVDNPLRGMGQHYLLCPLNHGLKNLQELLLERLDQYSIDGIAFHSTRTCRAMTNPQSMLAKTAERERGVKSFVFEGDVADASFYNDELFDSRLEAMLEAIDVQRMKTLV
ncbi:2-hydroxyacyl-CoA dehydratase family protein [Rhodococcus oxybenzonivorans]|uniref:2-hydroxyacyl-CoA dehydratase family protein n=2 Tax=Nocardiaceae TaxID=85025 RepID=A0AAE4UWR9_9NOCA|nr:MULTISPECIES: 2-hydroxyacyl-CoA dehydratase family protein [Rhodococcus]MDV7241620.1 2-hydroxyacyl-CoA dehydratase family protein [Rhodococcus oxybenzonivorans]MDV7264205.1 2-hydroxyacyl-CoA dehydratase family protein [Rhodococcus oxybenzonivorans]MDV7273847.1 2-hydroxyacyl-CoA dehydratase family protein [Rhodococcus oxybenzonivorans]MDV7333901.1 2-hydroxyacyl-CoA dehydratase family protein [Rhodococcus oxybenzonivorans]MDV7343320.1 2-hydroxyacyl-CoA dehydratase family protein [Rhodococcus 